MIRAQGIELLKNGYIFKCHDVVKIEESEKTDSC